MSDDYCKIRYEKLGVSGHCAHECVSQSAPAFVCCWCGDLFQSEHANTEHGEYGSHGKDVTIVEALSDIRFLSGELWARSVSWRRTGWAVRVLPPLNDGSRAMFGYGEVLSRSMDEHLSTYVGEWELVEPRVVIEARKLAEDCEA